MDTSVWMRLIRDQIILFTDSFPFQRGFWGSDDIILDKVVHSDEMFGMKALKHHFCDSFLKSRVIWSQIWNLTAQDLQLKNLLNRIKNRKILNILCSLTFLNCHCLQSCCIHKLAWIYLIHKKSNYTLMMLHHYQLSDHLLVYFL